MGVKRLAPVFRHGPAARFGRHIRGNPLEAVFSVTSHHSLTDLTNYDDHPQYLYIAGRTGAAQIVVNAVNTDGVLRLNAISGTAAGVDIFSVERTASQWLRVAGDGQTYLASSTTAGILNILGNAGGTSFVVGTSPKWEVIPSSTEIGFKLSGSSQNLRIFGTASGTSYTLLTLDGPVKLKSTLALEDPGAGTNTVTLQAPTAPTSHTLTLPTAQGAANTVFINDGAGNTSWTTVPAAAITALPAGVFANPTASLGLTAVNGVATTAMRSDGAPALDVSIAPTWTGFHYFTAGAASTVGGVPSSTVGAQLGTISHFHTTASNFSFGLNVYKRGATGDATAAVASSGEIGYHNFYGWDGTQYTRGAYALVKTREAWTAANHGCAYRIAITKNAAAGGGDAIYCDSNGFVGLGFNSSATAPSVTCHVMDRTASTGSTTTWIQAGAAQSTTIIFGCINNAANAYLFNVGGTGLCGIGVTTSTKDLGFGGTAARTIGVERAAASTAGATFTVNAGGGGSTTANQAGGNLILTAGASTGTANGQVLIQSPTPGASGTGINALATRLTVDSTGLSSIENINILVLDGDVLTYEDEVVFFT